MRTEQHHKGAPRCQSCGRPVERPEHFGTNRDGRHNTQYCSGCFRLGEFTKPDATRDEMVVQAADSIQKQCNVTREKAEAVARELVANLLRWRRSGKESDQAEGGK